MRDGVAGARIDAIASEAGIARSHLYYHFKSKDEIFAALIELRTEDLLSAKAALFDELDQLGKHPDSEELIRSAIARVMVPHRDFLRLLLSEAIRRPHLPVALLRLVDDVIGDTIARLGEMQPAERVTAVELFYLLVAPALFAVVLPADPAGTLGDATDVAPVLARALAGLLIT